MANLLAKALNMPEISLNKLTGELEGLSGYPSEDARLISELVTKNCSKITDLGLDPRDTRSYELYQALLIAFGQTSQAFGRAIGEQSNENLKTRYERIDRILNGFGEGEVWALKRTAVKKLLQAHPPRRLMKHLKYRSVDSLLKREDALQLFLAGQWVESTRWQRLVMKAYVELPAKDFETRKPHLSVLPVRFWSGLETKRPLVIGQPEIALVAVWPNQLAKDMTSLGVIVLSLSRLADLYSWSVALDRHHLESGFGKVASQIWKQSLPTALAIAGRPIRWRSLCFHYGPRPPEGSGTGDFENAWLNSDRLANFKFAHSLSRLHILLNWWAGNEYLLFTDSKGKVVSLNIADVAVNHARSAPFARQALGEAQASLYDELINRYLWHAGVSNFVSEQILRSSEKDRSVRVELAYRPRLSQQVGAR